MVKYYNIEHNKTRKRLQQYVSLKINVWIPDNHEMMLIKAMEWFRGITAEGDNTIVMGEAKVSN